MAWYRWRTATACDGAGRESLQDSTKPRAAIAENSAFAVCKNPLVYGIAGHSNGIMMKQCAIASNEPPAWHLRAADSANDADVHERRGMGAYYRSSFSRANREARVSVEAVKYWAFISYSHSDAKVAGALQRGLETYRLPRRLVGARTAVCEVPVFLKPVFRDRDEMQAGADLKATVREALGQSRYLIVVCSPNAARSPWVNREIIEFKKLRGESHVLALIAAGEPFASRMPGRETEECFPGALRFALTPAGLPEGAALEPIAADLRPQGDGKRLATLKLVAGMVGVGVDELVRRDAQRRARRAVLVAAASVLGMAIMAVLTVVAVQSRSEAQNQHAQAEDLIEFMLGDLRKKLDPVGRLDVLDAVGEKALGYYARQDADRLDANALGRRSRAMHLIGEMRDKRGQLAEALAAFRSAADTTAELLERAPNDGQRIFDHAQSVYWVGYIAWRRGQADAAEEAFRKYLDLARELVALDAKNVGWQLETSFASNNLGVVQLESGRAADALNSFTEYRRVMTDVVAARPELALELGHAHGWVAKALEASGDFHKAIEVNQEKIAYLRSLPDFSMNKNAQHLEANAYYDLGRLELQLGRTVTAEDYARKAVYLGDSLSSSDTANMFWLSESCLSRLSLAEIEIALGKPRPARADIDVVAAQVSRLIASDNSAIKWQIKLQGRVLELLARSGAKQGQGDVVKEIEKFLATVARLESSGKTLSLEQESIVAAVELALGDLLNEAGNTAAATGHWRAVLARLQARMGQGSYPVLTLLARAHQRLGENREARALAARVQASKYRHPAYAEVVNELARVAGRGPSSQTAGRN
jgi:tetratricopeptide (TPR) repeat protein